MAAPARSDAARDTLTVLCRALLEDVDGLADRLTRRILEREDVYGVLGVPVRDDLRATCRASLERLLTQLAGDLPVDVDAAALTVDTGRRRARQGVPLEVVLRAYRQCGRLVWERMRAVSQERFAGAHDAALLVVADDVWRILDASSDRLVDAYRREETRLRGLELGRRWAVLEGLLAGRGREPGAARDAARVLDLPEDAEILCVVAPFGEADDDPLPAPAEALAGVATSIWHARAAEVVGVIVPPEDASAAIPAVVAALRRRAQGPVGVSPVVRGLGELDVAHRWARLAARTLPLGRAPSPGSTSGCPRPCSARRRTSCPGCAAPPWATCSTCPRPSAPRCSPPCAPSSTPTARPRTPRPPCTATATRSCTGSRGSRRSPGAAPPTPATACSSASPSSRRTSRAEVRRGLTGLRHASPASTLALKPPGNPRRS